MKGSFGRNNFVFRKAEAYSNEYSQSVATAKGVSTKTISLVLITMISALVSIFVLGPIGSLAIYTPIIIADLIVLLVISFVPRTSRVLTIPYAIMEGLLIGTIAGILELALPNLGLSLTTIAFVATLAIFLGACALYLSGAIRVTNRLRKFMFTAIIGLLISSLIIGIASIFNPSIYYVFNEFGPVAILVSVLYIVIAAVYTVISLDNAYSIVQNGLGKEYEWYAAFGILINIIWLFYEILRLVIIIASKSKD